MGCDLFVDSPRGIIPARIVTDFSQARFIFTGKSSTKLVKCIVQRVSNWHGAQDSILTEHRLQVRSHLAQVAIIALYEQESSFAHVAF